MFGHQDDHHHHDDDNKPMDDVLSAPAVDNLSTDDHHNGAVVSEDFNPALPPSDYALGGTPADDNTSVAPVQEEAVVEQPAPAPVAAVQGDLLSIKQQALTELSPLVGHLDQSPEEKFRTTMMMIQASDNQDLIATAYEAAQAIQDEKVKAQALLDIVNEINYFTAQHQSA